MASLWTCPGVAPTGNHHALTLGCQDPALLPRQGSDWKPRGTLRIREGLACAQGYTAHRSRATKKHKSYLGCSASSPSSPHGHRVAAPDPLWVPHASLTPTPAVPVISGALVSHPPWGHQMDGDAGAAQTRYRVQLARESLSAELGTQHRHVAPARRRCCEGRGPRSSWTEEIQRQGGVLFVF